MLKKLATLAVMCMMAAIAAVSITLDHTSAKAASEEPDAAPYVLREHQGKIGVFTYNSKIPQEVLDVPVDSLPRADKAALATGITAQNREQLDRLIEDYDG